MDTAYTRLEKEIAKLAIGYSLMQKTAKTDAELVSNQKKLAYQVAQLNIPHLEKKHPQKFIFWLIIKHLQMPDDSFIEILSMVHSIDYGLNDKCKDGYSLLHYLCQRPNPFKILSFYFKNFYPHIIDSKDPRHPLLTFDSDDQLFRYLILNFSKYNDAQLSPLNFAIECKSGELVKRILHHFPQMIDGFSLRCINPLMQSIYSESEEMLDLILSYKPVLDFKVLKKSSLGHLIFLTKDTGFLEKIIFDPKYAVLNLQHQITSKTLRNQEHNLPIFSAINMGHYRIFEHILSCEPSLKLEFPHIIKQSIKNTQHNPVDYLYHHHQFIPSDNPEFFSEFIRLILNQNQYHLIEWLSEIEGPDINYKKVFILIKAILNLELPKINELLNDPSIPWDTMHPALTWEITELLIRKNLHSLIIKFDLFERCDFFISPDIENRKLNFLSILMLIHGNSIETKIPTIYRSLIDYFCQYLDRHRDKYPMWVTEFIEPIYFITKYLHDYRIDVHGEPLFHFFESRVAISLTSKSIVQANPSAECAQIITEALFSFYQNQMTDFLSDPNVDINIKNEAGLHLFAKLITTNQLARIRFLKEQCCEISLENLDPIGSNLLHLACQNEHLDTVKWCISVKIDPLKTRPSDHRLPIEIAFENQHMSIVNYLRKLVKPSNFIELLKQLISNGNDKLIHYLVHNGLFGFKLTPHHLEKIKAFSHPILNFLFRPHDEDGAFGAAAEAPELTVEVKPAELVLPETAPPSESTVALNLSALNTYRHLLERPHLENINNITKILKRDIYQEPLREIFGSNILAYAEKIITTENTGLIKQFFRIPVVVELMNVEDNWYHLLTRIPSNVKSYILKLILEIDMARSQIQSHLSELIMADTSSNEVFSFFLSHFDIPQDLLRALINQSLESGNFRMMTELLKKEDSMHILLESPIVTLMSSFEQNDAFVINLLALPFFQDKLSADDNILLKHAIYLNKPSFIKQILKDESVRSQLVKTGFPVIQGIISNYQEALIPIFLEYPDLEPLMIQFPEFQSKSAQKAQMTMKLPLVVHVEELYHAISTANHKQLHELFSSMMDLPEHFEQLLQLSIKCRNFEAFQFIFENGVFHLHHHQLIKSLIISAIQESEECILRYIIDSCHIQDLYSILDFQVFLETLSSDKIEIISYILQFPSVKNHAHKSNLLCLKKAINHQRNDLIDLLLGLPNVYHQLINYGEILIAEALKQSNPEVLFHLLFNHVMLKAAIQNPRLSPTHLIHFAEFFIHHCKQQRSISPEKIKTLELMQSTEALTPFHGELHKLKQHFLSERKREPRRQKAQASV